MSPGKAPHLAYGNWVSRSRQSGNKVCVRRSAFGVRRSPFAVHRSPFTVHRSPFTVHRSPFTVHRSPFSVCRLPFTVHRLPFAVCRLAFAVRRLPFAVCRSFYLRRKNWKLLWSTMITPVSTTAGAPVTCAPALSFEIGTGLFFRLYRICSA
jgi:hypothetical protein